MALEENNGMGTTMLVQPSGYAGNNSGFGSWGGDGFWIILLFLLLGNNGWGMGGFGGGLANDSAVLYPWMNQSNQISGGFRDQMLGSQISGIQSSITSGFGDVQTALCSGFAGVNAGIANAAAQAEISANARQVASMQSAFANQTAMNQGFNALQSQLAQCCCDNRAATADLKYTVATEECATRNNSTQNAKDIIDAQSRGTQAILDKLCALELEGVKGQLAQAQRENVGLQNQLSMAQLAASQNAQTAAILANNEAQTAALEQYLAPVPRPAYVVQNPSCCNQNFGCGCAA